MQSNKGLQPFLQTQEITFYPEENNLSIFALVQCIDSVLQIHLKIYFFRQSHFIYSLSELTHKNFINVTTSLPNDDK